MSDPNPIDVIADVFLTDEFIPVLCWLKDKDERAKMLRNKLAAAGLVIRPAVDDDTRREVERAIARLRYAARQIGAGNAVCRLDPDDDIIVTGSDLTHDADLLSRFVLGEATDGE